MNLWFRAYESVYPGPQDDPFLCKYSPIFLQKRCRRQEYLFLNQFSSVASSQTEQKFGTGIGWEGGKIILSEREGEPPVCVPFGQLLVPTGMLILWLHLVFPDRPAELTCGFSYLDLPFFQSNTSKNKGQRSKVCNKSTGLL